PYPRYYHASLPRLRDGSRYYAAVARGAALDAAGSAEDPLDTMGTATPEMEHGWVRRARPAGRPLIFAHRGGAGLAPEDTFPAFEQSDALGVEGFELDVHVSRDGEVIVIHDDDLVRTTGSRGIVSALTADQLSLEDAGATFSPADAPGTFPFRGQGIRVPRL